MSTARVSEIFCSIQGEGLYAGRRQIFVRLAGCDLSCPWCDEPAAAGTGRKTALAAVKRTIRKLASRERVSCVSITGGEPLLQPEAVRELALFSRNLGLEVHLETNGTRFRELSGLADAVDVVAADIKLPGRNGPALWREHKKFLSAAPEKTFVKTVVTSLTSASEMKKAAALAASVREDMPFFIQPVTPKGRLRPPSAARLRALYVVAAGKLKDVRILPQLHPLWGVK